MMRNRAIADPLVRRAQGRLSRVVVLTGARQTGKTTLVQHVFSEVPYISVEDPMVRPTYTRMTATDWIEQFPNAVIDEVQKAPSLVETIKAAHDISKNARYILLGSSQIQLLSKVKESLAGRVAITELWPLTLPEMLTSSWEEPVRPSRFLSWLTSEKLDMNIFLGQPASHPTHAQAVMLFNRYLRLGGMPAITDPTLPEDECHRWIKDYQRTYLERDVADLAALRDLEPFVRAQRVLGERSGKLINYSDLARSAGIAPDTARRFVHYLELSYQAIILRPYFRNAEKRLSRAPKIHFLDPGVLRAVINRRGDVTGEAFESAVVAEVYKQIKTAQIEATLYHLRTHDGREVDLMIELEDGYIGIEVKQSSSISKAAARSLIGLTDLLDKPLLGSLVLSNDLQVRPLAQGVLALPAAWALAPEVGQL
ncbi:MAG: ATP-binding protein [Myxococcota bacterium]|nr:ATP-binding protein [Myxococcota bacterium]